MPRAPIACGQTSKGTTAMRFFLRPGARLTALAAATALLSGCISFGAEPPESLLTLTPETMAPAGSGNSGSEANALAVLEPEATARLNVIRVPVQVDDTRIAYLVDATWVDRPARLFRRLLAETIRARTGQLVVDSDLAVVPPTVFLRGSLREFGYDAQASAVVMRYDAVYSQADGTVRTRRFESVQTGIAPDAASVGPALNRAANDVAMQVADWLG